MPYCPKCRAEYRQGFTKCADCDVELVDELSNDIHEHENVLVTHQWTPSMESETMLDTFTEPVEFMYVVSMLEEMEIPFLVRSEGGVTIKGLPSMTSKIKRTIFVEEADIERAKEVVDSLDAYLMEDYDEEEYSDEDEDGEYYYDEDEEE